MSTSRTSMKCRKCEERAAIRMRHHHIALCKDHYLEWFTDQTERAIKKYHMFTRSQRILVAVSGGKDSLALWDVLTRLGYPADGLYINLGIAGDDDYSKQSEQYASAFAQEHELKLHIVNIKDTYGASIPTIASKSRRGREKPCGVCGLAKRHVMNRVAREGFASSEATPEQVESAGNEAHFAETLESQHAVEANFARRSGYEVLATAHNLDDEVAVLMSNVMNWHVDQLSRQSPVLEEAPGFARKVKPFCRFYERETAAYTLLRRIEYIEEECPFAVGSKQLYYKDMLNKIEEEQPGTKLAFYVGFLKAKESGSFQALPAEETEGESQPGVRLNACPKCGQPTSNHGLCAFCKTIAA
jgi:tRNA-5-methyluridine54 2-sulfurtransferase